MLLSLFLRRAQGQANYGFFTTLTCNANATSTINFQSVINMVIGALREHPQHTNAKSTYHEICEDVKALCKQNRLREALPILHFMDRQSIRPDSYTYASLLQSCISLKAITEGKQVHAHIILTGSNIDGFLGTKIVIMYIKFGFLEDARQVFDEMSERNVVSWTAMIAAYARYGPEEEALTLFYQMRQMDIEPNEFTFASVLPACASLAALEYGKDIHEGIIRNGFQGDVFVGNALVDMYAKCNSIKDARDVFGRMTERNVVSWNTLIAGCGYNGQVEEALELLENMPERNEVSWNAMISGYVNNGYFDESVNLFGEMQRTGMKPNAETFASVLKACTSLAALHKGKVIHDSIIKRGFQFNVFVGSALVDMYAKCESIEDACKVFDEMPFRNVVSWNAMIAGYAQNGRAGEALKLFQNMTQRNMISWNAMIAGCAQNRLLGEAVKLFQEMPEKIWCHGQQ